MLPVPVGLAVSCLQKIPTVSAGRSRLIFADERENKVIGHHFSRALGEPPFRQGLRDFLICAGSL